MEYLPNSLEKFYFKKTKSEEELAPYQGNWKSWKIAWQERVKLVQQIKKLEQEQLRIIGKFMKR